MNDDLQSRESVTEDLFECGECGADVSVSDDICPSCGNEISEIIDETVAFTESPVVGRYLDLYRIARLLNTIGDTVKVIGIVIAVVIFFIGIMAGASSGSAGVFGAIGFAGALYGGLIGGFIALVGIGISAQGQILFAQADSAVHTSPFLTTEEKAKVMSIPFPIRKPTG